MDSIIEALEKIEEMLLQQQSEINQLRTDVNALAKLLLLATQQEVAQQRPRESESQP